MRARWQLLFACSITSLVALSWTSEHVSTRAPLWAGVYGIGMVVAAASAGLAIWRDAHRRWPALIAGAGALPLNWALLSSCRVLPQALAAVGAPMLLLIVAPLATLATAISILLWPQPLPTLAPIPAARAR